MKLMKVLRFLAPVLVTVLVLVSLEAGLTYLKWPPGGFLTDPFFGYSENYPPFVPEHIDGETTVLRTSPNLTRSIHLQGFYPHKKPGSFRVLCTGGSTVNGGENKIGFPFVLSSLLNRAAGGRTVEVINAGGLNYDSTQIAWMMPYLREFQPNVLVLYSGHNEFLNRRVYRGVWGSKPWLSKLRRRIDRFSIMRALRFIAGHDVRKQEKKRQSPQPRNDFQEQLSRLFATPFTDEEHAEVIKRYRANLEKIISLANERNIVVILCVPASNLVFRPYLTDYSPGVDGKLKKKLEKSIKLAQLALVDDNYPEAVEHFSSVVKKDPGFSLGHYLLAECLRKQGKTREALASYRQSLETARALVRSASGIVSAAREIEKQNTCMVLDIPAVLKTTFGPFPGARGAFIDYCHFTGKGSAAVATAIEQWIVKQYFWKMFLQGKPEPAAAAANQSDYDAMLLGPAVREAFPFADSYGAGASPVDQSPADRPSADQAPANSAPAGGKAPGSPVALAKRLLALSRRNLDVEGGREFQDGLDALSYSVLMPALVVSLRESHPSVVRFLIDLLRQHRVRYEALQTLRVYTAQEFGFENFSGPLGVMECIKKWGGWWKANEITVSQREPAKTVKFKRAIAGEWIKSSSLTLRACGAAILSGDAAGELPRGYHPAVYR